MSRPAEEDVELFLSEQHSFQDIMAEAMHYRQLAHQIQYTPCKVNYLTYQPRMIGRIKICVRCKQLMFW